MFFKLYTPTACEMSHANNNVLMEATAPGQVCKPVGFICRWILLRTCGRTYVCFLGLNIKGILGNLWFVLNKNISTGDCLFPTGRVPQRKRFSSMENSIWWSAIFWILYRVIFGNSFNNLYPCFLMRTFIQKNRQMSFFITFLEIIFICFLRDSTWYWFFIFQDVTTWQ